MSSKRKEREEVSSQEEVIKKRRTKKKTQEKDLLMLETSDEESLSQPTTSSSSSSMLPKKSTTAQTSEDDELLVGIYECIKEDSTSSISMVLSLDGTQVKAIMDMLSFTTKAKEKRSGGDSKGAVGSGNSDDALRMHITFDHRNKCDTKGQVTEEEVCSDACRLSEGIYRHATNKLNVIVNLSWHALGKTKFTSFTSTLSTLLTDVEKPDPSIGLEGITFGMHDFHDKIVSPLSKTLKKHLNDTEPVVFLAITSSHLHSYSTDGEHRDVSVINQTIPLFMSSENEVMNLQSIPFSFVIPFDDTSSKADMARKFGPFSGKSDSNSKISLQFMETEDGDYYLLVQSHGSDTGVKTCRVQRLSRNSKNKEIFNWGIGDHQCGDEDDADLEEEANNNSLMKFHRGLQISRNIASKARSICQAVFKTSEFFSAFVGRVHVDEHPCRLCFEENGTAMLVSTTYQSIADPLKRAAGKPATESTVTALIAGMIQDDDEGVEEE